MATSAQVETTTTENAFSWRFVTPMFLGSSLNPVNSSLIVTALVPIAAAMHVSAGRPRPVPAGRRAAPRPARLRCRAPAGVTAPLAAAGSRPAERGR